MMMMIVVVVDDDEVEDAELKAESIFKLYARYGPTELKLYL